MSYSTKDLKNIMIVALAYLPVFFKYHLKFED